MTLAAGTRLGPYEVLSPLGAGGMGEVYRARDSKLKRDVAIKVLPESLAKDADALARFEREAHAVAALNHPNILSIHDFGSEAGVAYAVTELLEGETLRSKIEGGAIPQRRAVEIAIQIARGLAAAHEKGVVHRDLKPENVFLTVDGRVKILDFGLAKRLGGETAGTNAPTTPAGTEPGTVMGTVGYMSPEQVRGRNVDARTDIFAFGAILYEMLSGTRAFKGDSHVETMNAILKEEPPELADSGKNIPLALDRIVRHCLEKSPESRFHSAGDIAFDLESLSASAVSGTSRAVASPAPRSKTLFRAAAAALAVGAAILIFFTGLRRGKAAASSRKLTFTQMTFPQQPIYNARFAPDGKTIVYSTAPRTNSPEIFTVRPENPGGVPRGLKAVELLSISSKGELAVLTHARYLGHSLFEGTLARMPLDSGAPRDMLDQVREADWSPDGSSLAVIRRIGGKDRLEYPIGKVLCEVGGYLSNPRVSPRGDRVAFFEHPIQWDDRGSVAVVDLSGRKTVLSAGYGALEGLAWSARGDEVLFSGGDSYSNFSVYGVTLAGKRRTALQSAGGITIQDVHGDGKWLATRDDIVNTLYGATPGEKIERNLSWLDYSLAPFLSADGKMLLFSEQSGTVGDNYAVCLRGTDGSAVIRLGDGEAEDFSPDGKWALAAVPTNPQQLVLYPTGAGEPRKLDRGAIESYDSARFFADGRSIVACGPGTGQASRCYVQDIAGGRPRAVTPEGTTRGIVSPDGRQIVVRDSAALLEIFPFAGGDGRAVPGSKAGDVVIRWERDGRSLLVFGEADVPARVERLDVSTGRRELVRTLGPANLASVNSIGNVSLSDDAASYAYDCATMVSHLFLVDGAR